MGGVASGSTGNGFGIASSGRAGGINRIISNALKRYHFLEAVSKKIFGE